MNNFPNLVPESSLSEYHSISHTDFLDTLQKMTPLVIEDVRSSEMEPSVIMSQKMTDISLSQLCHRLDLKSTQVFELVREETALNILQDIMEKAVSFQRKRDESDRVRAYVSPTYKTISNSWFFNKCLNKISSFMDIKSFYGSHYMYNLEAFLTDADPIILGEGYSILPGLIIRNGELGFSSASIHTSFMIKNDDVHIPTSYAILCDIRHVYSADKRVEEFLEHVFVDIYRSLRSNLDGKIESIIHDASNEIIESDVHSIIPSILGKEFTVEVAVKSPKNRIELFSQCISYINSSKDMSLKTKKEKSEELFKRILW